MLRALKGRKGLGAYASGGCPPAFPRLAPHFTRNFTRTPGRYPANSGTEPGPKLFAFLALLLSLVYLPALPAPAAQFGSEVSLQATTPATADTTNYTLGSPGTKITVSGDGSAAYVFDGIISGAGSLHKNGSGTLVLGNTGNSYTGGTLVSGGSLRIKDAAGINPDSRENEVSGPGSQLTSDADLRFGVSGSGSLTITDDGKARALRDVVLGENVNSFGAITLGGSATELRAGGSILVGAAGSGLLAGSGTVIANANGIPGDVIVGEGSVLSAGDTPGAVGILSIGTTAEETKLVISNGAILRVDMAPVKSGVHADMITVAGTASLAKNPGDNFIIDLGSLHSTPGTTILSAATLDSNVADGSVYSADASFTLNGVKLADLVAIYPSRLGTFTTKVLRSGATLVLETDFNDVRSAIMTWTSTSDNNWDMSTPNWTNSSGQKYFLAGDAVLFNSAGGNLLLSSDKVTVSQMDVTSGTWTFNGNITATADAWVGSPVTPELEGSLSISGQATSVTLSGNNSFAGGISVDAGSLTLHSRTSAGSAGISLLNGGSLILGYSGAFANDVSGQGRLFIADSQTVTVSGTNSHEGDTGVDGTLIAGKANSFSKLSVHRLGVGGKLDLGGLNQVIGGLESTAGGLVLLSADLTLDTSGRRNATYAGAISGAGKLTKTGTGTAILTGTSSHSGGTLVSKGTLQIGAGGKTGSIEGDITVDSGAALLFSRSNAYVYNGNISGRGDLIKSGSGDLTLGKGLNRSASSAAQAGKLHIASGNLAIIGQGNYASDVTVQAGATLSLTAARDAIALSAKTLDFTQGGALNIGGTTADGTFVITTTDGVRNFSPEKLLVSGASKVNYLAASAALTNQEKDIKLTSTLRWNMKDGSQHGTFTLSAAGSQYEVYQNLRDQGANGTRWNGRKLTKKGPGTLILSGDNSYSGGTTVTGGLIAFHNEKNFGTGKISLNGGGIEWLPGNTLDISGRLKKIDDMGAVFNTGENTVIFETELTGSGDITKTGAGTLVLAAKNSLLGDVTVSRGTLQLGTKEKASHTPYFSSQSTIDLEKGTILAIDNDSTVTLLDKVMGHGRLRKSGWGTLYLTDSTDHRGGTDVLEGTLSIGHAGSLGSGFLYLGNGTTLELTNSGIVLKNDIILDGHVNIVQTAKASTTEFGGVVDGTGSLYMTGDSTLILSGDNRYVGMTTLVGGTLILNAPLEHSSGLTMYGNTRFIKNTHLHDLRHRSLNIYGQGAVYEGDMEAERTAMTFNLTRIPTKSMLTVTGTATLNEVTVQVGASDNIALRRGSTISLLKAEKGLINASAAGKDMVSKGTGSIPTGMTLIQDLTITTTDSEIIAILGSTAAADQSKALAEAFISGAILVNQGADFIAGSGVPMAVSAAATPATGPGTGAKAAGFSLSAFGGVSSGLIRANTGSHVDMRSVSLLTGLACGMDLPPGRLTLGAFFEYGNGSYDTHNSFSNAASVDGDGNTWYLGGGVLGRLDFAPAGPGHAYTEASARIGKIHNDYESSDLRDANGSKADFETSSAYYGLHVGLGYNWRITEKASVDLSGKYFWTHQEGDGATIGKDEHLRFKSVDSHRLRPGARFSYVINEHVAPYIGAAWEYEFGGKARATTNGHAIEAPTLKGGTGIGELGLTLKPSSSLPLNFDLGVQGYTGKREGVTGSLQLRWEF